MKQTTRVATALLCATLIIAVSCSKTSEDKLTPAVPTGCDTANSKYATDVAPILQANCYSCHGNGATEGGVNLDTYGNVKEQAINGDLPGGISHASGYSPMPKDGAKLSDCDINTIQSWIKNGMLNN